MKNRSLLLCRLIVLAGGVLASVSGYPPAHAQAKDAAGHDELIQHRIDELESRIIVQDGKIDKQWLATNSVKEAQATQDGELKGFGIVITLISGAGLVIQIRPKPKA